MKQRTAFILCWLLTSFFARAQQAPVADFKSDITSGCFPIVVKFQDLTTNGPVNWEWDLGNGTVSTLQNPAATYLEPGRYNVKLKATNAAGTSTVVKDSFITVYAKPIPNFQVSDQSTCTPAPIQFTDLTQPRPGNTIVSWKWDFGDGFTSTEQNPVHIYTAPAEEGYTITLTVANDKGCSNLRTEPNYIKVIKGVVPRFSNTQQTVCKPPVTINFTNNSTGPQTLSYKWDFGNGQTSTEKNPAPVYTAVGSYPVTLIVESSFGCTDTLRRSNVVDITQILTDFTVPAVCPNTEVQFFDSSSEFNISNLWRFSDGSTDPSGTAIKVFPNAGTFPVTLINTYATCVDSITKNVVVSANPLIDFSATPTVGCQLPFATTFTSTGTPDLTYAWDFGDGNGASTASPSHTYTALGNYNVTVTTTNATGCSATATKAAFVKVQKPSISFTNLPDRGCIPFTVSPVSAVTANEAITAYRWDFGDGGTSTAKDPTYTYTKQGEYIVSLTVTTASGCTETYALDKAIQAGTKPTSDFIFDKGTTCARDAIQFTDKSSSDATEWLWDFGDGQSSSAKSPSHEFQDLGPLHVSLQAVNTGCKGDVVTKTVTIKGPIAVYAFRQDNCADEKTFKFDNKSVIGNDTRPLTWRWNFGDGSPIITSQNPPPHTFPSLNTFNVSLYVSNGECEYTYTRAVKVARNLPDFEADVRSGCKPFSATFTPTNSGNAVITSYTWNFGDGTTATSGGPITHVYNAAGNFTVTLVATNEYGCSETSVPKQNFIQVNGPVAKFSSATNKGCIGLATTFIDETTTDGRNPIVNWRWDFGDRTQQTYTAPPFTHTYAKVARYDVKLVVQDAAGCKDSVFYDNFVSTSSFRMDWNGTRLSCPGAKVQFNSSSNTRNYSALWDFGNGATQQKSTALNGNTTSVNYAYPDTGTYTVKLVLTDTLGCKDSLVKQLYTRVYRPIANFSANNFSTYCVPFEARFENKSTYYTSSSWSLGIGTSTQTNPVSYYTNTGTYTINLKVESPGGCTDDTTRILHVYDAKDGKLTYGPLNFNCRPMTVDFNAFADMNGTFVWDFGDGTVVDTSKNIITHTYDNVGNFIPKVILREPDGCLVPITGAAPVQVSGANIKFDISKRFFCDSGTIAVFDSTVTNGTNVKYNWDFGDGTAPFTSAKPISHTYRKPGIFPLKLTISTGEGCVDSVAIRPGVKVSLTPVIHINGDSVICVNEFVKSSGVFDVRDTSFIRWAWQFPDGTSSALQTPADQRFPTAGRFPITSIATNSDGCADTSVKNVLVHPLPTSTLPSTVTMQAGYPITLEGVYSSNVVSYKWRPETALSCTTCPNPIASPKFNTKYVVTYIDSNSCRNSDIINVVVICKNANIFIPNTFSPNNDGSNDMFYVRGRGLDRVKSMRIFNRWGEVVFEKRDFPVNTASVGWDGRYNGAKPKPDVYIYQVEIFCENNDVIRLDGNVALIQ